MASTIDFVMSIPVGKWHYVFFIFDSVKKIILSYPVSPNRDTVSAIKALDEALSKFKEIPDDLTISLMVIPSTFWLNTTSHNMVYILISSRLLG